MSELITKLNPDLVTGALESGKNIKTVGGQSLLGEGDVSFVQPITYKELRILHELQQLIPGQYYRITDYKTSSTSYMFALNREFDLIVRALDNKTLSENAKAAPREGTTYFDGMNLGAWEIKYDLINDSSKYDWSTADPANKWISGNTYEILHQSCASSEYPHITQEINGETWYLYPALKAYLSSCILYKTEGEVRLVTQYMEPDEENYTDLTLMVLNISTGQIYKSWEATYYWSEDNIGFGGDEESDFEHDAYLTYETVECNGETYYIWDCSTIDLSTYVNRISYVGDYSNLYYASPTQIVYDPNDAYEDWYYEDDAYFLGWMITPINYVYDATTGVLYNWFDVWDPTYEDGEDPSLTSTRNIDYIVYNPGSWDVGKGVIYYLKDDKNNSAGFDFKNIPLFVKDKVDASHTMYNNTITYSFESDRPHTLPRNFRITASSFHDNVVHLSGYEYDSITISGQWSGNHMTVNKDSTLDASVKNCEVYLDNSTLTNLDIEDSKLTCIKSTIKSNNSIWRDCQLTFTDSDITLNRSMYYVDASLHSVISPNIMLTDLPSTEGKRYDLIYNNGSLTWKEKACDKFLYTFDANTITMDSGIHYKQKNPTSTLTLKLNQIENRSGEYHCEFTTASNGTSLICDKSLAWEGGIPELDSDAVYLLSIYGSTARCERFYYDPSVLSLTYTTSNSKIIDKSSIGDNCNVLSNTYQEVGTMTLNKALVHIPNNAFYSTTLTSIDIPGSVKTIGTYAFDKTPLHTISIPQSVKTIKSYAFDRCSLSNVYVDDLSSWFQIDFKSPTSNPCYGSSNLNFYVNGNLTNDIRIPSDITTLNGYACAFPGKSLYIPNTVTKYTNNITRNAVNTITIDSPVLLSAHSPGPEVSNIIIGNSIKTLPNNSLYSNANLTHLTLPSSISNSIALSNLCYRCSNLTDVTINCIPGKDWFQYCTALPIIDNIRYAGTMAVETTASASTYTLKSDTQYIGNELFYNKSISSIELPSSLKSIGEEAFRLCRNLTNINIPDSVYYIGASAFYGCTSLTELSINSTNISNQAFSRCSNLKTVNIGSNVKHLGSFVWDYCSISKVNISNVDAWCSIDVADASSTPFYDNEAKLYLNNEEITTLTISKNTNPFVFARAKNAFEVTVSHLVDTIGVGTFDGSNLKSILLPKSLVKISSRSFAECVNLTTITIPKNVNYLGYRSFASSGLKEIYLESLTPPTAQFGNSGWLAFEGLASDFKIYVPQQSLAAYKSAEGWKDYANFIEGYYLELLPTFSVSDTNSWTSESYEYEDGMTWGEWINSEYNIKGWYINEWGQINPDDESWMTLCYEICDEYGDECDYGTIYEDHVINPNMSYYFEG